MPAKKAIVGRFERLIVMRVWWNVMSERRKITIASNASTHCYRHIVQEWLCSGFSVGRYWSKKQDPYTKTVKLAAIAASIAPRVSSGRGVKVAIHTAVL